MDEYPSAAATTPISNEDLGVFRLVDNQGGSAHETVSDSMSFYTSSAAVGDLLGTTLAEHEVDWAIFEAATPEEQAGQRLEHFQTMLAAAAIILRRPNDYDVC